VELRGEADNQEEQAETDHRAARTGSGACLTSDTTSD
jgi:hypothetical protein